MTNTAVHFQIALAIILTRQTKVMISWTVWTKSRSKTKLSSIFIIGTLLDEIPT